MNPDDDGKTVDMVEEDNKAPTDSGCNKRSKLLRDNHKQIFTWKIVSAIFILTTLGLLIGLVVAISQSKTKAKEEMNQFEDQKPVVRKECSGKSVKQTVLSTRSNKIFSGLTEKETQQVIDFLMAESDLHLVPTEDASISSNYIYTIEDYLPNKREVINYQDGHSDSEPTRKARAILFMGETKEVHDYLVWPIPNPQQKSRSYINRPLGKELTWKSRPFCDVVEAESLGQAMIRELTPLVPIMTSSFSNNCSKIRECLFHNQAPRAALNSEDRHVITWFFAKNRQNEDYYMYPLPFYIILKTPVTGDDYDWKVSKIFYNDREFTSVQDLIDEYATNTAIHYRLPDMEKHIGLYGSPRYVNKEDTVDQSRRPPVPVYIDGQRFTIEGHYVEWLSWSFSIHPRTLTGLQIFDVRFMNERIAYELSMQDVLVTYSGKAPDDFFKHYFDNGWSIGMYNMPLIRDIDCPPGAVYLDSDIYEVSEDSHIKMKDAICVFEHRNSIPLRRHFSTEFTAWGYRYAFSMPDTVLIVRQILTVWNYDYIFDYEFHQNGVVEIKVSSTGYVAVTSNLNSKDMRHGFIINHDWNAGGNLHQHLFNFKLDVDINGTANRFKTMDIKHELVDSSFSTSKWSQMIMTETLIQNERDALIKYNFDKPKYYIMYNMFSSLHKNAENPPPRGYRVVANGFSKVVLPDESDLIKGGASWAKYQVAVTKHDDNERTTASHFIQGDPFNPAVDFQEFSKDNDSLVDKDLVVWVTVGLHHIPTYEDLPVTTTPGKTVGAYLMPFNFFYRDPSIHSRDAAIFWNRLMFPFKDDYLSVKDTCPIKPPKPEINIR